MKYIEFQTRVQEYLNKRGCIHGYISQQKSMATLFCIGVLKQCDAPLELFMEKATGCGFFYELYARIPLGDNPSGDDHYDANIGRFTGDQTTRKQVVKFQLYGVEKYGDEEFTHAVHMVAMDTLRKRLKIKSRLYEEKSSEADSIHEELNKIAFLHAAISLSTMPQEELDILMKDFSADKVQRAAQEIMEEKMVRNAPKEPITVHPAVDAEFFLTSGRCSRKSWIRFATEQEWTVSHFSGDTWVVERDEIRLFMSTFDIISYFGQTLEPV